MDPAPDSLVALNEFLCIVDIEPADTREDDSEEYQTVEMEVVLKDAANKSLVIYDHNGDNMRQHIEEDDQRCK